MSHLCSLDYFILLACFLLYHVMHFRLASMFNSVYTLQLHFSVSIPVFLLPSIPLPFQWPIFLWLFPYSSFYTRNFQQFWSPTVCYQNSIQTTKGHELFFLYFLQIFQYFRTPLTWCATSEDGYPMVLRPKRLEFITFTINFCTSQFKNAFTSWK